MFENALTIKNISHSKKIAYKTLVSVSLIFLAVILPQLVHLILGQLGGVKWLPMYLPVLIGGCLLGTRWGLVVGTLSPFVSFIITSALGNPMPMAPRLPFMVFELAVFAVISGLFTNNISKNGLWAFPAVIVAQLCGRGAFLGAVAAMQSYTQFTTQIIWGQIKEGVLGLVCQAVIVPLIIIGLRRILIKENDND